MRQDCQVDSAGLVLALDVLDQSLAVILETGVDDHVRERTGRPRESHGDRVAGPAAVAHGKEINLEHFVVLCVVVQ
jgi:hypothetical protein